MSDIERVLAEALLSEFHDSQSWEPTYEGEWHDYAKRILTALEASGHSLVRKGLVEEAREALRDANAIVAMTRRHLAADHPECAYEVLGIMNDASRTALETASEETGNG